MVHVATASGPFHARVIAARLGAAGILCEVQGGPGGTYPLGGCVEVLAPSDEADEARALLAADDAAASMIDRVEAAFGAEPDRAHAPEGMRLAVWAGMLVLLVLLAASVAAGLG